MAAASIFNSSIVNNFALNVKNAKRPELFFSSPLELQKLSFKSLSVQSTKPHSSSPSKSINKPISCKASNSDAVFQSRKIQKDATALLAEFLKSEDLRSSVLENMDSLTEQFFLVTSTYFEMAKKEKNVEVAKQLENVLKISMEEKEKTLRPEIRLLNQLIRETEREVRKQKISESEEHLKSDSYFFQLLNRMIMDVEKQKNPQSQELLSRLRDIKNESSIFS